MNACYLGENIVFKYDEQLYVIDKILDEDNYKNNTYRLFSKGADIYQHFKNKTELIAKGVVQKKYLYQILDNIKIVFIDYNTKKEFIAATMMNRKINFEYNGVNYFKSKDDNGHYIYCDKTDDYQYFSSPKNLLKNAIVGGKFLNEIWSEICILEKISMYDKYEFLDACYMGEKIIFTFESYSYVIDKVLDEENYKDNKYCLFNESTNDYQYFNNARDLINKGKVEQKYLYQIIDDIEILFIDYSTKKEFIAATIMNSEIEFVCNDINYFKSQDDNGYYIYCDRDKSYQHYSSPEELLKNGVLEGKHLRELWKKIHIKFIY